MSTRAIARAVGNSPTPDEHLRAMAAAAWHEQGVLLIKPEEIDNEWLRRAVEQLGNQRYGPRDTAPEQKRDG